MKKPNIRLLGDRGFLRWTDQDDALSKVRSGLWESVSDPETGRFQGIRKIEFGPRASNSPSPAAITARESLANVGIWDGKSVAEGGEVPAGTLHAAQAKIFFYPFEGDDKAVRASCLARA
jgi:hypothetical protein